MLITIILNVILRYKLNYDKVSTICFGKWFNGSPKSG